MELPAVNALDTTHLIALAAALGWASGLRLYAVLAITGLVGYAGWVQLPPGLQLLQHPAMLAGSGFMLFVEFFADKIPGLDSLWDLVHTAVRIPAGAALAASVFGADHATAAALAALLGGTLAATSHVAKRPRAPRSTPRPSRSPTSACRCSVIWRCRRCCGWRSSTRCWRSPAWPRPSSAC
ncbi:hypothetical protein X551_03883 [Methylibium sp. T29]|nr:hypothetical protein X551_03883 [Methylibium sp. T29]